jgi:histidinol dehydrogenase
MAPKYLKTGLATAANAPRINVDVHAVVKDVIDSVRNQGDAAVRTYSERFDKWTPPSFKLSQAEIESAMSAVSQQTIEDIKQVQHNVRTFAQAQRESIRDFELEIAPGVHLGQKNNPIDAVGA